VYRTGHLGVALLVYAPVGLALVVLGRADLAVGGGLGMAWLAMLPDYDQRVPFVKHRGVTHTVAFAVAVGLALGAAGWFAGGQTTAFSPLVLGGSGFSLGTLAVLAHLLGDVLTPAGIAPFWPLSGREYTLSVARADDTLANYVLLGLGLAATVGALVLASAIPS
jgi:inner membrane protein